MATYRTRYGRVLHSERCKDDWPNIVRYRQRDGWDPVKLQRSAMRSFKAAERIFQWRTRRRPGRRPIKLTGSWRSCEFQAAKFREDPSRFAPPDVGVHTHGLAIDVHQGQSGEDLNIIHRALIRKGWSQSRPSDEPWHYSYKVRA